MTALMVRERLADGTFGELKKVFSGKTEEEKVADLEGLNNALMLTVVDMYEENAELRELNRNVMLMVVELYEKVYAEEGEIE